MKQTATDHAAPPFSHTHRRSTERVDPGPLETTSKGAGRLGLVVVFASLLVGSRATAQTTYTWDGGTTGGGTSWNSSANWAPDGIPVSATDSTLLFNSRTGGGTLPATLSVSFTRTVGQLVFDNVNSALPTALNINTNGSGTTAQTLTIQTGVTLQNTATQVLFAGANGTLSIVLGANNTFTTSAGSYLQFNSGVIISGSAGIVTAGAGSVGLNAPNTFSGGVTVGGGSTLRIGTATQGNAVSTTVTGGVLASGQAGTGTLTLQDGSTLLSGGSGSRTLQNNLSMAGNITFGATTTYTGGFTFNSGTSPDTLTTPATIALTGNTNLTANFTTSLANVVSGGFGFTTGGAAAVSLSAQNTFSGGVTVGAGSTLRVGSSSTVTSGVLASGPVGVGTLTLQGGATLTPTGSLSRTIQNNVILSGNITLGATSTYTGDLAINSTGLPALNTVTLAGHTTLTNNVSTSINNVIGGPFSLTKQGPGVLSISVTSPNTYSGGTTIASGTLQVGRSNALGTGAVNLGSVGGGDASLLNYLAGYTFPNDISVVAGSGGTLTLGMNTGAAFTSSFTGGISLGDNLVIFSEAPTGFALRLSGAISGANNLDKTGPGMVRLENNNTGYSGTTTISSGTLQLGNAGTAGAIGSGGVANNAALVVNRSNALTLNNAISGTGSLTQAGSGTTTLSADNSYTGATTVSAGALEISGKISGTTSVSLTGGTLILSGASESIKSTASLSLSGGTRVSFSSGLSNRTQTFDSLNLLGSAILDFGNGNTNQLAFTNGISGLSGSTLAIYNWSADPGQDILSLSNTLSETELSNISFYSDGAGLNFLGTGGEIAFGSPAFQVVPIPEPSSTALLGAAGLLGLIGCRERRRLRRVFSHRAV